LGVCGGGRPGGGGGRPPALPGRHPRPPPPPPPAPSPSQSDWGATHSTGDSLAAGLDIEMPDGHFYTQETIQAALAAGNVTAGGILDRCHRILQGWFSLDPSKRHPCGGGICINNNVSTPAHKALAREMAAKATVLAKNAGGLLPLSRGLKLALIGPDAVKPYTGGQGSGSVVTDAVVSPLAALTAAGVNVAYDPGATPAAAAAAAAAADVAIVFGHASSGEGSDRIGLTLAGNTDAVIPAVAAAQPKTVVYLSVPGAIRTDWRGSVAALLLNFLPGEQIGPALVDTLFGAVPPQAKLPVTLPIGENDEGMTPEQYPGVPGGGFTRQSNYTEGALIGYRWCVVRGGAACPSRRNDARARAHAVTLSPPTTHPPLTPRKMQVREEQVCARVSFRPRAHLRLVRLLGAGHRGAGRHLHRGARRGRRGLRHAAALPGRARRRNGPRAARKDAEKVPQGVRGHAGRQLHHRGQRRVRVERGGGRVGPRARQVGGVRGRLLRGHQALGVHQRVGREACGVKGCCSFRLPPPQPPLAAG
jgi:hypothetical protein